MDNSNIFEVDPSLFSESTASESYDQTTFEPVRIKYIKMFPKCFPSVSQVFTNYFVTD